MMRNHSRSSKHSAFTLVELMVVILILALLVSLIASASVKGVDKLTENRTRQEISELEVALRAFMADYGLTEPPPSYLILRESNPLDTTLWDNNQSGQFLEKLFGKNLGRPVGYSLGGVDWNGDGKIEDPPAGYRQLNGSQCLVLFLGGIPNSLAVTMSGAAPAPQGFSTNNIKPSYGSVPGETMGKRKGPYYHFVTSRLYPQQAYPGWDGYFVYIDPWMSKSGVIYTVGTPYAFYSKAGIGNQYDRTNEYGASPYLTKDGKYMNPDTWQILSAGKDGKFGVTNGVAVWDPFSGATGYGADDQANFSATLLGAGQN